MRNSSDLFAKKSAAKQSPPHMTKPHVVFVLGGPGAGKGTQCKNVEGKFGYHHLSAGDLLREERQRPGSEYGELIETYIRDGKIVPVEITCNLLKRAMEEKGWENGKFLIDGFPRNLDNLQGWKNVMDELVYERFCLFFDCPEAVMENRLVKRGETSGRSDDNLESIRKRFRVFLESTMPIVNHFKDLNKLEIVRGDAPVEEVWYEVQKIFSK
jgi:UMP-CMP kinase